MKKCKQKLWVDLHCSCWLDGELQHGQRSQTHNGNEAIVRAGHLNMGAADMVT